MEKYQSMFSALPFHLSIQNSLFFPFRLLYRCIKTSACIIWVTQKYSLIDNIGIFNYPLSLNYGRLLESPIVSISANKHPIRSLWPCEKWAKQVSSHFPRNQILLSYFTHIPRASRPAGLLHIKNSVKAYCSSVKGKESSYPQVKLQQPQWS